jgi:hypothetical protein
MSHWTKIKTTLNSEEFIKKALTRMGIAFQEGNFNITQYGKSEKAEIKVDDAVGLSRQEDGSWSMVGDFYHSKKLSRYYNQGDRFNQDLTTAYSVEQVKSQLEEQQFYCSENSEAKIGQDGMVRMVYSRY